MGRLIKAIWSPMDPNVSVSIVSGDFNIIDKDQNKFGSSLLNILNGTVTMRAAIDYERGFWKNELNLYRRSGICYATRIKRIPIEKYFTQIFYLQVFIIGLYGILIVEGLIEYIFDLRSAEFLMNAFRILIGVAMLWKPRNSIKRIILLLLVFPLMIVCLYLQDELSSFVTIAPTKEIQVRSLEDLVIHKYKVFTTTYHRQYFWSTPFYNYISLLEGFDSCYNRLKVDGKTACASDCNYMKQEIRGKLDIKVTPDVFMQKYYAYIFPIDFPLLPRIRNVYYRLFEGGVLHNVFEPDEKITPSKNDFTISMDKLKSVTDFFIMGCAFSVTVFLLEICIFKIIARIGKNSLREILYRHIK